MLCLCHCGSELIVLHHLFYYEHCGDSKRVNLATGKMQCLCEAN